MSGAGRNRGVRRLASARYLLLSALAASGLLTLCANAAPLSDKVVLLHGLARSVDSMSKLANRLEGAGFRVCNIDYPSRHHRVETLAAEHVLPAIEQCFAGTAEPVNFVTHSLGGILVRQIAASQAALNIGRVVMLAPPNRGSEVVDKLGDWALFNMINGPAGNQLGTRASHLPNRLGAPDFEFGVIAGDRSINLILSRLIPGDDDGKVSIENTRLEGMQDFLLLSVSHPFIMKDEAAIAAALRFLERGNFAAPD